jgi:hypothetical protein
LKADWFLGFESFEIWLCVEGKKKGFLGFWLDCDHVILGLILEEDLVGFVYLRD